MGTTHETPPEVRTMVAGTLCRVIGGSNFYGTVLVTTLDDDGSVLIPRLEVYLEALDVEGCDMRTSQGKYQARQILKKMVAAANLKGLQE